MNNEYIDPVQAERQLREMHEEAIAKGRQFATEPADHAVIDMQGEGLELSIAANLLLIRWKNDCRDVGAQAQSLGNLIGMQIACFAMNNGSDAGELLMSYIGDSLDRGAQLMAGDTPAGMVGCCSVVPPTKGGRA